VGILLHSYRNCLLDVWRFSPTRQYPICHRSRRLGDRVGYTLDFKLYHYPDEHTGDFKDKLGVQLLDLRYLLFHGCCWAPVVSPLCHGYVAKLSKAIKERSARNSESEVNSDRSVSLGRQGGLITSISAPMFAAFKPAQSFSFRTDSTHCNCQRTTFFT
jgi:hypothetical protein